MTDSRFVDDVTLSHHSKEELIEGLQDAARVLTDHGFDIKIISTNFTLPADLQQKENEEDLESVFHHIWDKPGDMLYNVPRLNIHPKKRGRYVGPDLVSTPNTTLETVPITKILVARLLGQLFSLTGAFFAPVTACFRSLFNEACNLSKTWKSPILDREFNHKFRSFLIKIKETIDELKGYKRLLVPEKFFPSFLDVTTDGGALLAAASMHLTSLNSEGGWENPENVSSTNMDAVLKIKHHSVPLVETAAAVEGTELYTTTIVNHPEILEPTYMKNLIFTVRHGIDSMCLIFSLRPGFVTKNVMLRNAIRIIHTQWLYLSNRWENIKIEIYYLQSKDNISDYASKMSSDPVSLSNSSEWRYGFKEFKNIKFPSKQNLFITVESGKITWCGPNTIPLQNCSCGRSLCTGGSFVCGCSLCMEGDETPLVRFNQTIPQIAMMKNHLDHNLTKYEKVMESIIEIDEHRLYNIWLKNNNLGKLVRIFSRILIISADQKLKDFLGVSNDWINVQKEREKINDAFNPTEIPAIIQKIVVLSIAKTSQRKFPPKKFKSFNPHEHKGVTLVKTRYSVDGFADVFNTFLIPLISADDHMLLYRAFQAAHITAGMKTEDKASICHLPLFLTLSRMKSGPLAMISPKLKKIVSRWISMCSYCIIHSENGRRYPHAPQDPQLLSLLHVENAIFHTVSLDVVGPFNIRNTPTSRKGTYPVQVLIAVDLATGTLSAHVMPGAKMKDVVLGLQDLANKWRMPVNVVTDAGSNLKNLENSPLFQALSKQNINMVSMPACHQFGNFCERVIKEWKKIMILQRESTNQSIYNQPVDLLTFIYRLRAIENAMSLRPILTDSKEDGTTAVLTPAYLTKPYLNTNTIDNHIQNMILKDYSEAFYKDLTKMHKSTETIFKESLLTFLQSSAIAYQDKRVRNSRKVKGVERDLTPLVGDVVLFQDSLKHTRFGRIINLKGGNLVQVICISNNKTVERDFHIRELKLCFRNTEWNDDIPTAEESSGPSTPPPTAPKGQNPRPNP